jgi:hypothetical protein
VRTPVVTFNRLFAIVIGCTWSAAALPATSGISAAQYRTTLLEIYGRYQGVLAHPEACNAAFPKMKPDTDKAFAGWRARHKRFIDELEERVALMVRAYSKDEKDYSRNYGRFQGAVLKQREEVKQTLLVETRGDLEARCRGLPEFLSGRESDLETEFANDIRALREWQLPQR